MDLGNLAGQAGELLNQHGDKVEGAVDQVAEVAKAKFGEGLPVDAVADQVKGLIPDGPGAGEVPPAQ